MAHEGMDHHLECGNTFVVRPKYCSCASSHRTCLPSERRMAQTLMDRRFSGVKLAQLPFVGIPGVALGPSVGRLVLVAGVLCGKASHDHQAV